ncbi:SDR family NAD(P)-dependent oxidoreductase [Burkholderia sp. Bp9143]|uniref:SDR family NAD(P)-dependent oxidoreductase n=1 Tax=Burkholderia sp. Bp9143 TaxID=2184574 RepID=UPI000F5B4C5A|nr:SDR family oxidoreductase [Burkholderia sp. Bp9143]RQR35477.1 SDR family NAD(P)-dependent oxidoreductase [Burkholderia sp. Bp9143]
MSTHSNLVVVTGGASGIGEATARRFAAAGSRVVIGDVNEGRGQQIASELREAGRDVVFYSVDLASDESIGQFAGTILKSHGVPDALVNSGGILQNARRLLEMDIAEFDRLMDINVRGTLQASRAFGAAMCERGKGAIVNLCSLTTYRPSAQIGYAVGKAGLRMLTEVMAAEWGSKGVRVNAVAPGYTLTPAMQARIESGERDPSAVIDKSALGRFVDPAEVADAIFFLCSAEAAAITGVTLPVDCGWLVRTAYLSYASQP